MCALGNAAVYECKSGGENGIHRWVFGEDDIATCTRCKMVLSIEHSDDLRRSNERFLRELRQLENTGHE